MALESSLPAALRQGMRRLVRRAKGDGSSRSIQVVVCGGSVDAWRLRSDERWNEWATDVAGAARREGIGSVTVYPLSGGGDTPPATRRWNVEGVTVSVIEQSDGRRRLADVIDSWPSGLTMTEETLGRALVGSGGDTDVVAVVGAPGRLPTALVWELAYAELVDLSVEWEEFNGDHVSAIVHDFRTRNRRFGGVDGHGAP